MTNHSKLKGSPCICGNLSPNRKPVSYENCCGDKPEPDKLYYDKGIPKIAVTHLRFLQPFFSTNPSLEKLGLPFKIDKTIKFKYLSKKDLAVLFSKGLPVFNPKSPFSYEFQKLNRYLSGEIDREKYFILLSDILYNEWSIDRGRDLFNKQYLQKLAEIKKQEAINATRFAEIYQRDTGIIAPKSYFSGKNFLSIADMEAKWLIDDMFFRIRAHWDKLLYFLSKGYFGFGLSSDKLTKKINELKRKTKGKLSIHQKVFIEYYYEMLNSLEELKKNRDKALHTVNPRAKKALAFSGKEKDILEFWEIIKKEHNKAREGLIVALGITIC